MEILYDNTVMDLLFRSGLKWAVLVVGVFLTFVTIKTLWINRVGKVAKALAARDDLRQAGNTDGANAIKVPGFAVPLTITVLVAAMWYVGFQASAYEVITRDTSTPSSSLLKERNRASNEAANAPIEHNETDELSLDERAAQREAEDAASNEAARERFTNEVPSVVDDPDGNEGNSSEPDTGTGDGDSDGEETPPAESDG